MGDVPGTTPRIDLHSSSVTMSKKGPVRSVRAGRGKSGAYRVCYAYFARHGMVFLLTAYGKNEQANLTKSQQNAIARAIREIEASIEKGEIR